MPVPEDAFHAKQLGITEKQHRLEHELLHHLVGLFYYKDKNGSPVVYRDVHHIPLPAFYSMIEEWLVTGLTYSLHEKEWEHKTKAMMHLQERKINLIELKHIARWLLDAPQNIDVIKINN